MRAVPRPVRAYMDRMMALPGMIAWGRMAQKEVDAGLTTLATVMRAERTKKRN